MTLVPFWPSYDGCLPVEFRGFPVFGHGPGIAGFGGFADRGRRSGAGGSPPHPRYYQTTGSPQSPGSGGLGQSECPKPRRLL